MKRYMLFLALFSAALSGCNSDGKKAAARLENARQMFANGELAAAKSEIDSIRILYPKEIKTMREGLTLMRQVELKEAESDIVEVFNIVLRYLFPTPTCAGSMG